MFDTKLLTPVTVIPGSHTSLTSDFSWLFFLSSFLSYRSSDQLNIYFRSQKSHGPISNINLTQTSSVTSHDFDKVLFLCFWVVSICRFTSSPLWVCRVIDGRKEWSDEIMRWCEREQNENEMKHEVWLNLMKALRLLWWIMSLFWKRKLRSLPSPEEKCIYLHK